MRGYAKWLSLTALVFAAGCAAEGSEKTGTVGLAASAVPAPASSPPTAPPGDESLVHLDLDVKEIRVHVALDDTLNGGDGQAGEIGNDANDDLWVTIPGQRDLTLQPGATAIEIGMAEAPIGTINEVRLVLNKDATLWNGMATVNVACPSCMASGLKLKLDDGAVVREDRLTTLKLLFDLNLDDLEIGAGLKLGPIVHVESSVEP